MDYRSNKFFMGILLTVAVFVVGSNTYNQIATVGTIDAVGVLKESFGALTTLIAVVNSLYVHKFDLNGQPLPKEQETNVG